MGQSASAKKAGARLRLLAHTGNTAELRKHVGVVRNMCNAWLAKEQEKHARSSDSANSPVSRLPAILNSADAGGRTALMAAVQGCNHSAAEFLLACEGVAVNAANQQGWTALTFAARRGRIQFVMLLLKHGADVDHDDHQQRTPLMHATICGFPHIIRVLAKHGADVDAADIGGCTPLMIAAEQQGHLDTVELLIEEGAEVNAQSKGSMWTPLMRATLRGRRAVAQKLVKEGAAVNGKNKAGWTPLQLAGWNGHWRIAEDLIKAGAVGENGPKRKAKRSSVARSRAGSGVGRRSVASAASKASTAATKVSQPRQPRPPLIVQAATRGQWMCVKELVEQGAQVDEPDTSNAATALFMAASNGYLSLVRYLVLEARANMEATDKRGLTPLMAACYHGHLTVVKYLVAMGAVLNNRIPAAQAFGLLTAPAQASPLPSTAQRQRRCCRKPSRDCGQDSCYALRECVCYDLPKCACLPRKTSKKARQPAPGTATGFTPRALDAPPMARLRAWQLVERQRRWQHERAQNKKDALYRKQHRIAPPKRRLGDLLDAPEETDDTYVITARLPFCKAAKYDRARPSYHQIILPKWRKWFACICKCQLCVTCCQRCHLSCVLCNVLRKERKERLRIPGHTHVTALDLAELNGFHKVATFLKLRGGLSSRELVELEEEEQRAAAHKAKLEAWAAAAKAKKTGEAIDGGGGKPTRPGCCPCLGRPAKPRPAAGVATETKHREPRVEDAPHITIAIHAAAFETKSEDEATVFKVRLPTSLLANATVLTLKHAVQQQDPLSTPPAVQQLSIFMKRDGSDGSDNDDGLSGDEAKGAEAGTWVTLDDDDTALAAYGIDASKPEVDDGDSNAGVEAGVLALLDAAEGNAAAHGPLEVRTFEVWLHRGPASAGNDGRQPDGESSDEEGSRGSGDG